MILSTLRLHLLLIFIIGNTIALFPIAGCKPPGVSQDSSGNSIAPVFKAQTIDSSIQIGYGLALGDVDGDGKADILLADKKQVVWYRNGDWRKFVIAENLTASDNVCIAARDITGDGKVEVAIGAQWNPSETTDSTKSGAVFYLQRPMDPTMPWKALQLPHEPTVHRMRWISSETGKFKLVVVPLHGRGNKGGEGAGVRVYAYDYPGETQRSWHMTLLDSNMHLTHNFEPAAPDGQVQNGFYLGGKEGVRFIPLDVNRSGGKLPLYNAVGELRKGKISAVKNYIVTIEPMHGNEVVAYLLQESGFRVVLDSNVREGHALAVADFLQQGHEQIVAGWRVPNADGKVGLRMYVKQNNIDTVWNTFWIDENGMACEDIQVADLDGDGKMDIVASGRATRNVKIYWNR